jgi:hypothetical protein
MLISFQNVTESSPINSLILKRLKKIFGLYSNNHNYWKFYCAFVHPVSVFIIQIIVYVFYLHYAHYLFYIFYIFSIQNLQSVFI